MSLHRPAHGFSAFAILLASSLTLVAAGCSPATAANGSSSLPSNLQGTWQVGSSAFYYDAGGGGAYSGGTYALTLSANGWTYGSSSGSATTSPITSGDWARWNETAYGPTQKLTLDGWNGGTADGPIEAESNGTVDFVWVIYHVQSPEPGSVWLKFEH